MVCEGNILERRREPRGKRIVKQRELATEDAHGPAIGYGMVENNEEEMVIAASLKDE